MLSGICYLDLAVHYRRIIYSSGRNRVVDVKKAMLDGIGRGCSRLRAFQADLGQFCP